MNLLITEDELNSTFTKIGKGVYVNPQRSFYIDTNNDNANYIMTNRFTELEVYPKDAAELKTLINCSYDNK